jgi:UPF0271 protein
MPRIDINCDLGEGFGVYQVGQDERVFPLITSANIACGFHAGEPVTMQRSVELAIRHHVSIGAHPGTPDLVGFGRRRMDLLPEEIESILLYQIGALDAMARAHGAALRHVKPHGWLYNEAARNLELARVIARAVKRVSPRLILFGLSGSLSIRAAEEEGVPFAREAFVDRAYLQDGTLAPRSRPGALITNPARAAFQALRLAQGAKVVCLQSGEIPVAADTLCVHGDNPAVIRILREVRKVLREHKVQASALEPL